MTTGVKLRGHSELGSATLFDRINFASEDSDAGNPH